MSRWHGARPMLSARGMIEAKVKIALLGIKKAMTASSAALPEFAKACEVLGLDPDDLTIPGSAQGDGEAKRFMFWQPGSIVWMLMQELSVIRASILASDCGTGKTVTALGLVVAAAGAKETSNKGLDNPTPYRPTLIITPTQSIDVWYADMQKFYPDCLSMYQFYDTSHTVDSSRATFLIDPSAEELTAFLDKLDLADPKTVWTMVISSYKTRFYRTIDTAYENDTVRQYATKDDNSDDIVGGRVYSSKIRLRFERVICDKAYYLRNPRTKVSEAIRQTNRVYSHFLTATPILNHAKDFRGLLSLIWNPQWQLSGLTSSTVKTVNDDDLEIEYINMVPDAFEDAEWNREFLRVLPHYTWILDPQ
ncbi:uncharacterized protein BP5553_10069 [Venustampulla echinocandica]|uniref:SNF2 N-terminal domain-containing protein n=1 Tax=Venustampulla echinocandica TaxID=2656787 RepID=A0A370TA90_9HELO|nr:uncharacterized protein BP5553_10069 [Venustampulla echinocandica]RDL30724.1 hypothetical protein BP5553_10069 [Venustampulla echinocandica]